ncbi:LD-carboxypeptidase [bacterium]|nr:LD-carboxypeptidase [bacterium]
MIPEKLKKGDEIRIIAPSCSAKTVDQKFITLAKEKLESLGFKISFSKNFYEHDLLNTSDPIKRAEDLNQAFSDKDVKAIIAVRGGFPSNELLELLDYDLIKKNPKIFCGYSDITALSNAIYAKTGLVTYSGPNFGSFAMIDGFEYTLNYFIKMLVDDKSFEVFPSKFWSEDRWKKDQENRNFIKNSGPKIFREGKAEGEIVGGNMCTLQLLQGTAYYPNLKDKILFLEEDGCFEDVFKWVLDRNFSSLLQQPNAKSIKAIVFGRMQSQSKTTFEELEYIFAKKFKDLNIPIIYNLDFGHTNPMFTFPIGGRCKIDAKAGDFKLEIL